MKKRVVICITARDFDHFQNIFRKFQDDIRDDFESTDFSTSLIGPNYDYQIDESDESSLGCWIQDMNDIIKIGKHLLDVKD